MKLLAATCYYTFERRQIRAFSPLWSNCAIMAPFTTRSSATAKSTARPSCL